MYDYRTINRTVMTDTLNQCGQQPLKDAIIQSINKQYIVYHEDNIRQPKTNDSNTRYIVSEKRSFEAAMNYPGKKIAVLSFANNHSIGGAPFSAGAQEESLCRCSTLYPCLKALENEFYNRHIHLFEKSILNHIGNDDLIYTPDVVVFKTDERTDPVYPQMMNQSDWYRVNVITCAAPELRHGPMPKNYIDIIHSRIQKILDVAAKEKNEVLILGAFGCGAFKNPLDVVAKTFRELLKDYSFDTVEFAMSCRNDVFIKEFTDSKIVTKQDFTGIREGEIQKENVFSDIPEEPLNYIRKWYTPGKVTSLKYNQIFVYGSNIYGSNGAGAARDAEDLFGAKSGIGEGRNGQCYAIPTMDGSVEAIKPYVDRFIEYAAQHKELEFLLTPIGCGIAGYTPQQIAPLFKEGLKYGNIVFPRPFIDVLIKK